MVKIYRATDAKKAERAGYEASYVADLTFRDSLNTCGVILVKFDGGGRSTPHLHEKLEEVFIAISDIRIFIDDSGYDLMDGDVVIVEPGEAHSFEPKDNQPGKILALKFPNLSDDKIIPNNGSES
ncbi:MAG: cupin domain-containing protein [Candidatus Thorarchaeota archaeon]